MLWKRPYLRFVASVPLVSFIHAQQYLPLADEIINGFGGPLDCASCHSLLVTLRATAALGDNALTNSLKNMCKQLKVCHFLVTAPWFPQQ
jgi:sphingomyelin phosphodiesterase